MAWNEPVISSVSVQPLTVITGILLGSAFSITLGLSVTMLVFVLLSDDYPRLAAEFRTLALTTSVFLVMTVLCAFSFNALVRTRSWWLPAQLVMWGGLAGVTWYLTQVIGR